METKYDSYILMVKTAIKLKIEGKMVVDVIGKENYKDIKIELNLNDQTKKPLVITDDPYIKGDPFLILQEDKVFSSDILEKRKDNLRRVTVYYKDKEYISFDNFDEYINWLGIDK